MADVRITGLHKRYGAVPAVRGIDLDIRDGEFTVLVGPSGCGKSTLLRTIAGLEEASRRHHRDRRRGRQRLPPARPRRGDGLPGLRALPAHERRQEHRLRPEGAQDAEGRGRRARRRGGAHARHHAAARPLPAPALRRPAPARRHRPRHRAQPAGLPVRRAALQPRRPAPRRDARRDQAAAPGASPRR